MGNIILTFFGFLQPVKVVPLTDSTYYLIVYLCYRNICSHISPSLIQVQIKASKTFRNGVTLYVYCTLELQAQTCSYVIP